MGLLDTISAVFKKETRDAGSDDKWYDGTYTSDMSVLLGISSSGIPVSPALAIKAAAVYACIRVLTESVSSLPFPVFERLPGGGKRRAPEHPLYPILHDMPNPEMTAMVWREVVMGHLASRGNHYSEIERVNGRPVALWPLNPDRMKLARHEGQLLYIYQLPGKTNHMITPGGEHGSVERVVFMPDQVLHIKGLSSNGLIGFSPITLAAEAIGLSLAASAHGSRFFQNDASPGGVLEHPNHLKPDAYERMKKSWQEAHGGLKNAHRIAILEEGVQFKKVGLTNKEAQFLETRKFQRSEIAGIFRVPPHMIGDMEKATFSNIEHQALSFVTHSLTPWLVRIEQEINKALLFEGERSQFFAEHVVDALLRGDIKSRYEAYSVGRQNGWLSADDVRAFENMNPLPDDQGKIYMVPLNMVPASTLQSSPSEPIEPTETEPEESNSAKLQELAKRHEGIFIEVAGRVVRYEIKNIRDASKKYLKGRDIKGFDNWVIEFYRDFDNVIIKNMDAAFRHYAESVKSITCKDVNNDIRDEFIHLHIDLSKISLRDLIVGEKHETLEGAVSSLLKKWNDNRPAQIAMQIAEWTLEDNHGKTFI